MSFKLRILALDKEFYNGPCDMVIFSSEDGEYGVLPKHENTVATVVACEVRYKIDGEWQYAAVSHGFAEITPEKVTILADTVESPEDIDAKRAELDAQHAKDILEQKISQIEYTQAQLVLAKSMARLKVKKRAQ